MVKAKLEASSRRKDLTEVIIQLHMSIMLSFLDTGSKLQIFEIVEGN